MNRKEIIEMLKQVNPIEVSNDGPTAVFLSAKSGKKTKTFYLSGEKSS